MSSSSPLSSPSSETAGNPAITCATLLYHRLKAFRLLMVAADPHPLIPQFSL